MLRFLAFPLISSAAVILASAFHLFVSTLLLFPVELIIPRPYPSSVAIAAHRNAANQVWSTESVGLSLMGASILLGLGLAGYETVLARRAKPTESVHYLAQNIFWFGLYLSVLSTPIAGTIQYLYFVNVAHYVLLVNFGNVYFSYTGFVIVLMAWVYSIKAGRVFTPRILTNRLRYGRFQNPTL